MISVVFSFRNEQSVLHELVERMVSVFEQESEEYELIFVNDDSSDDSLDILLKLREQNDRIKIINMSRRFGVSECVLAGFAHASGDAVIYMDCDLQDPPELISSMLAEWRNGADVVNTVRTKRHGENYFKLLCTKLAYKIISFGSIIQLVQNTGDFKLISRVALEHVKKFQESDPYLRGVVTWVGFKQVYIEYEREARHSGITHFPFFSKNPWKTFVSGLTSFSFLPIYIINIVGFIGIIIAGLLMAFGLIFPYYIVNNTIYWLSAIMLTSWSILTIFIGVIGIYIIRIYKDVRGRPLYIVREKIGW